MDASRYHIVWGDKPISPVTTADVERMNWWATEVMAMEASGVAGDVQKISVSSKTNEPLYAAVFSFDQHDNMSEMSNVARLR